MEFAKLKTILVVLLDVVILGACSMFIEEDIDSEEIALLAPMDNTSTEVLSHTFWWTTISGASSYRLQIVNPAFEQAELLLLDSLIEGDKFDFTLYPGAFEWRVRGENSAYVTKWTTASIMVYSSDDLSRQKVRLNSPAENAFSNMESQGFAWEELANANTYRFEVYSEDWGLNLHRDSSGVTNTSLMLDGFDEGEFFWGVQALNEISHTLFSTRRLVVDRTSPIKPSLEEPVNSIVLSDSIVFFRWSSNDPVWTKVTDKLVVVEKKNGVGDVEVYSGSYTTKSAKVNLFRGNKYGWRIESRDQAGNISDESDEGLFSISD